MSITKTKLLKAKNLPDIKTLINTLELTELSEQKEIDDFEGVLIDIQNRLRDIKPKFDYYKKELNAKINKMRDEVKLI